MMSQISPPQYHKAVRVRDSILQEYSFELIKERRLEYQRTKEPSLLKFNRLYLKYNRNIKVIREYERQHHQIPIFQICDNCYREQQDQNIDNDLYNLQLIQQNKNNIKIRKKFKDTASFTDHPKEIYLLCKECNEYLTLSSDEIDDDASVTWCSFIWTILTDENIHIKYGVLI